MGIGDGGGKVAVFSNNICSASLLVLTQFQKQVQIYTSR